MKQLVILATIFAALTVMAQQIPGDWGKKIVAAWGVKWNSFA